jgi:hypothetical protein
MFRILRRLVALAFVACLALVGLGAWLGSKPTPTAPPTPAPSPSSPITSATTPAVQNTTTTETAETTATNNNEPQPTNSDIPPAADPPAPAPSAELAHEDLPEDQSIAPAIVAAAGYCLKNKTTAEATLAASPEIIGQGRVLYLKDGADVIGPTAEGVQLLLNDGTSAFLNGVSTQNLVSGRRILPGLVFVRGSKQYTSVLGANRSAWLLDAISDSEWAKAQSLVKRREDTKRRNELRDELATIADHLANLPEQSFTSADGQFSTIATITDFVDGSYVMRRNDGTEIRVEDGKLDEASQFAARQQMKRVVSAKRRATAIEKELGISSPLPLATSD